MKIKFLAILLLIQITVPLTALAQDSDEPIVYGILFYSTTCPHCEEFIANDLPGYEAEFGDQFVLTQVETSGGQGRELLFEAGEKYNIERLAVPMMILGDTVMIGNGQINSQAPDIIRNALQNDGLDYPDLAGFDPETIVNEDTGFSTDDLANVFAVVILFGLLAIAAAPGVVFYQTRKLRNKRFVDWFEQMEGRIVLLSIIVVGAILAISLIFNATDDGFALIMATLAFAGLAIAAFIIGTQLMDPNASTQKRKRRRKRKPTVSIPEWIVPLVILSGLVVAVYLSYVEVGEEEAACGVMGDCNAVQQSEYAELFGLIPIGVMGIAGYVVLLGCWGASQLKVSPLAELGSAGMLGASLFGVLFSAYLTFLEPFVIKATCTWCLTSAVVMMALLWLSIPKGWPAIERLLFSTPDQKTQAAAN